MSELTLLQAIRLKGRVSPADVATTVNEDSAQVASATSDLANAGLLVDGQTLRLTPDGRRYLDLLLAQERAGIDENAMRAVYHDFCTVNAEFKALVSDWQLKNGAPNNHDDASYDAAVLGRLDGVHGRVLPIIAAAAVQTGRLGAYGDKLTAALEKISAGETNWLTRPLIDSYHTVWFELHEELILASGLTREEEANAGNAQ